MERADGMRTSYYRDTQDDYEWRVWVGVGCLVLLVVAAFAFAIVFRTTTNAVVTQRTWNRAINIEQWKTVEESDWGVPQGGRTIRFYSAFHHFNHIYIGSYQVCSGTGTTRSCYSVSDYIDQPVYETKYDYAIERWIVVRQPEHHGVDSAPTWPDVTDLHTSPALTIGDERAGMRLSKYTVKFSDDYALDMTEERWATYKPGQHVTLVLNIFKQALDVK